MRHPVPEVIGFFLLAAFVGWILVTSVIGGGDPAPQVALVVMAGLVFALARLLARAGPWLVPAGVLAIAGWLAFPAVIEVARGARMTPLFGYGNAAGAFFMLASIAGFMFASGARLFPAKLVGLLVAVGFVAMAFWSGSFAAAALSLVTPLVMLAVRGFRAARFVCLGAGAAFLLVLVTTVLLGATYSAGEFSEEKVVEASLTERRLLLWNDAINLMAANPITGVGPGRFSVTSPTALADADTREAHNEFLQTGAETGLLGALLLTGLFLWGFARLRSGALTSASALSAVALAATGIHGSIDYVLHFPVVTLFAAALAANGMESAT